VAISTPIGYQEVPTYPKLTLRLLIYKALAYDPHIADEVFERYQVRKVSWEELLTQADAVSAHVSKNAETTGMIGASEIA